MNTESSDWPHNFAKIASSPFTFPKMILSTLVVASSVALVNSQASETGNCLSGRIYFNPDRIVSIPAESAAANKTADPNQFDLSIDYGTNNVAVIN